MPPRQSPPKPCFLLAGGGTGGHLFPGLAVADALAELVPGASLVFAGPGRDWERDRVVQAGFEYLCVASHPVPRNPAQLLPAVYRNVAGYRQMAAWLKGRRVTAVIGLGGYAGVPALLAARRRGIPTFLLEQNVVPGKATCWLAAGAEGVFTSFDQTRRKLSAKARVRCTGNPLRREITRLCFLESRTQPPYQPTTEPRTLLVTGGSQGAQSLNRAVLAALARLAGLHDRWRIIHQTGERDYRIVTEQYARLPWSAIVQPVFASMAPLYEQADLAVSRAGATTLSELACAGVPAVVLPYPHAAEDHQTANARCYAHHGAVVLVQDRQDTDQTAAALTAPLADLMSDAQRLRAMSRSMQNLARPEASTIVAKEILAYTRVAI